MALVNLGVYNLLASRLLSWLQDHQCVRRSQISRTPSSHACMWGAGAGDQREGQQGRYRHGRDGQNRGCNAPGAGTWDYGPV